MRTTKTLFSGLLVAMILACLFAPGLATSLIAQGYSFTSTALTKTTTITTTTSATWRQIYSKITITPTATFSVTGGGSITPFRGEVNFTTGKTFTDGFLYGVQGKTIFTGTFAEGSAARITGVLGQVDVTGATLTSGQLSAVWADLQGGAEAVTAETYVLRVSNSMSTQATALGLFVGHATYALAFSDLGTAQFVENTSGTGAGQCAQSGGIVATKALKINANGTDYWIPLCTAK
jgi:hypothetical protein